MPIASQHKWPVLRKSIANIAMPITTYMSKVRNYALNSSLASLAAISASL